MADSKEFLDNKDADAVETVERVSSDDAAEATDAIEDVEIGEVLAESEEDDDSEDSLTYSNGVIEKIVAMATREVPHVLGMKGNLMHLVQETFGAENLSKGVTIEVTDDNRVVVNISVIIEYGCYAPAIFEDVKERVTERLTAMTGLEVAGINLRIEDVVTREEYEASRRRHAEDGRPRLMGPAPSPFRGKGRTRADALLSIKGALRGPFCYMVVSQLARYKVPCYSHPHDYVCWT